tara:strand:+ start:2890 stop:6507 length:3618 start_codon:yes stop_codon:yes gene_type:complete
MNYDTRQSLIELVRQEVLGPEPSKDPELNQDNGEEILLNVLPKSRYGAGVLFPQNSVYEAMEENSDDDIDLSHVVQEYEYEEDKNNDTEEDSGSKHDRSYMDDNESGISDHLVKMINAHKPSAMGLSCILNKNTDKVKITVVMAVYKKREYHCKKCDNSGISKTDINKKGCRYCNNGYLNEGYFRVPLQFEFDLSIKDILKNGKYEKVFILNESSLPVDSTLEPLPKNKGITFIATKRNGKGVPEDGVLITFSVINNNISKVIQESGRPIIKNWHCFFQSGVTVELQDNKYNFIPLRSNNGLHTHRDKKINELLYRNKPSYAVGHGCAASYNEEKSHLTLVKTDSFPEYEMMKIDPKQEERFSEINLSFMHFADKPDLFIKDLKSLTKKYEQWLSKLKNKAEALSDEYKETAFSNIESCSKTVTRMKEGLKILSNNEFPHAVTAFIFMNKAIMMQHLRSKQSIKRWHQKTDFTFELIDDYVDIDIYNEKTWPERINYKPSWYPYQLAFILLNIKSIVYPESVEREYVECLWFPTGGGKTEAYLGLIAFTIFYRRLLDPECRGVTAVMRYTLRLLTAQQFQRASSLIAACDFIRRDKTELLGSNDNRISIGLWVGGTVSPNSRKIAVENYSDLVNTNKIQSTDNLLVVTKCPWCSAEMGKTYVKVHNSNTKKHRCLSYKKVSAGRGSRIAYLCKNKQCQFSTIELPVYVVDDDIYDYKPTLLIGTVDKFAQLPWGNDIRAVNLFKSSNTQDSPDLIIQDELHLISGPLGSIVGIYENTIQNIFSKVSVKKQIYPKIIASTATVTRASEQINSLYNTGIDKNVYIKEYVNLFPHPAIDYDDSFFGKEINDNNQSRIYIGLNPTAYHDPKTAQVRIISSILQAAKDIEVDEEHLRDPYWTLLIYYNSLRELSGASALLDQDVISYLKKIQRRKNADVLEEIYNLEKSERKWDQTCLRSPFIYKVELAARQTKDIGKALEQLEIEYPRNDKKPVDVCLATNMVSVGVDISRLGVMLVTGQPKTTSEYIQATSRIGRAHPGVVFVWYNNSRPRDKSHFEQFMSYHQRIYGLVEPTSITPYSIPVRDRALHAQIITLARYFGIRHASDIVNNDVKEKIKSVIMSKVSSIEKSEVEGTEKDIEKIFNNWEKFDVTNWGTMSGYLPNNEECFLMYPYGKEPPDNMKSRTFKTLTSMRNVDADCGCAVISVYPE